MRKWVVIFLLLINTIVFFGFIMLDQGPLGRPDLEVEKAFELRLVSEVAQNSLLKINEEKEQGGAQAWFVEGACISYEGLNDPKAADDIASFMAEQGLSPIILQQATALAQYQLVLAVPENKKAQLLLESQLGAKGIPISVAIINTKKVYKIGHFSSAGEAEKARLRLLSISAALQVKEVLVPHKSYSVQLMGSVDDNLISKINNVLEITYESLKIEKKVCKGVASTKPHQ